jgi:ectoine hydroxylase-related dioxygenase (phytanoyl-CoA dioxygenase family)
LNKPRIESSNEKFTTCGMRMASFFSNQFMCMLAVMDKDLAEFNEPIGDLFAGVRDLPFELADADVEFFEQNGYLSGIRLLDQEQIDILRRELAELMDPRYQTDPRFYEYNTNESPDPAKRLFHALGAWRVSTAFHDLVFHPTIAAVGHRLLGGQVRFWHDQLFVKPAHDGAVVAWHQDYSYWTRTKPIAHLTCWIGLDDSTIENGCVHYIPGSHKWDLLPRTDLSNDMDAVLDVLTDEQRASFDPVAIELKAGEASFHHPMMVHGSYENRSDRPRRAAVINMFRDGVSSDTDDPLLEGVPAIPRGQKIDGQFFPLIS